MKKYYQSLPVAQASNDQPKTRNEDSIGLKLEIFRILCENHNYKDIDETIKDAKKVLEFLL